MYAVYHILYVTYQVFVILRLLMKLFCMTIHKDVRCVVTGTLPVIIRGPNISLINSHCLSPQSWWHLLTCSRSSYHSSKMSQMRLFTVARLLSRLNIFSLLPFEAEPSAHLSGQENQAAKHTMHLARQWELLVGMRTICPSV